MFKYDILPKNWDIERQPPTTLQSSTEAETEATQVTPPFCLIKFFFENCFLKFFFLKNALFSSNLSSILVYTGYWSGIKGCKFHFHTLYIPKQIFSGVFWMKYWCSIFQKSKKHSQTKLQNQSKIEFLKKRSFLVISGHYRSDVFAPKNCLKSVV